jgi:hypothetical protein
MKMATTILEFLMENKKFNSFFIQYDYDKFVYHITSKSVEKKILKNGFMTGFELGISEKRKAIFCSDLDVNYGLYARNKEGETYEGDEIGKIKINLNGLKLLNMTYINNDGEYENYNKYKNLNVKGELDQIPFNIDGTISFLDDGRIYEVALKKEIANRII